MSTIYGAFLTESKKAAVPQRRALSIPPAPGPEGTIGGHCNLFCSTGTTALLLFCREDS